MKRVQRTYLTLGVVCAALPLALPVAAETNTYRVSPGETIEINIASLPDHNVRPVVQADGTITLPDIGSITVAGLTPSEMQKRLETILPTKLFHGRTNDGRVQTYIIAPADITSSVIAYRPVYVTGSVFTPGEQPFRPTLTARQAIAVAGGPSLIRGQVTKGGADPVDLQRDYQSLWTEYLKAHYQRERTKAEMAGVAEFDMRAPSGSPLPEKLAASIANGEAEALKLALEDDAKERIYLEAEANAAAEQVATLTDREKVEASAEKADQQDLAKVVQLLKSGNQTNDRVAETRRSLLLTSSRRLETLVELMRVKNQRLDADRKIEQTTKEKKIKLLDDLRETNIALADLEVKLQALGAKLQVRDIGTNVEPPTTELGQPVVTIVRGSGAEMQRLPATMETELLPGDVIVVSPAGSVVQGTDGVANSKEGAAPTSDGITKISMN